MNQQLDAVAADLKDFRGKISLLAYAYLEAESRTSNRDLQEVVREVLHQWAVDRHNAATVAQKLLRSEGFTGSEGER